MKRWLSLPLVLLLACQGWAATSTSLDVSWTAPTTLVDGSPASETPSYRLYLSTPCPSAQFAAVSQGITAVTVNGLLPATAYTAQITAVNSKGESPCSTTAAGSTLAAAPIQPLSNLVTAFSREPPKMANVAFDAKMTAGNSADGFNQQASSVTSISSTGITVGASATLLAVPFVIQGAAVQPSGVTGTWNGSALTLQVFAVSDKVTAGIATIVNPAAGANTLALAWTNTGDCYMGAVSFTGTDTSTGVNVADNTTTTQTTAITVTSSADGATVAVFGVNGSTPTVDQTKLWAEAPLNPGGGASYALGGASNTHNFTGAGGSLQALAGVHVIAAPGGDTLMGAMWF